MNKKQFLLYKKLFCRINHQKEHRSKRISSNFDEGIPVIKEKFTKDDCPLRFIGSVVKNVKRVENEEIKVL